MRVLIAIHGSHSHPERMQAQRETWLAAMSHFPETFHADSHTLYRYFVGQPAGSDTDVTYLDSPDGPLWAGHRRTLVLNRKTEALARYAFDCGYDFVFKCDDDTYVFPDRLLASGFEAHDYSGFMGRHHAQDVGWYAWAQGGAGYWLSRRAMEIIAAEGLHRARAEDFAVGQLLAAHGLAAHHDERYVPAVTEQDLENPPADVVTLHKVNPPWMRRLHARD